MLLGKSLDDIPNEFRKEFWQEVVYADMRRLRLLLIISTVGYVFLIYFVNVRNIFQLTTENNQSVFIMHLTILIVNVCFFLLIYRTMPVNPHATHGLQYRVLLVAFCVVIVCFHFFIITVLKTGGYPVFAFLAFLMWASSLLIPPRLFAVLVIIMVVSLLTLMEIHPPEVNAAGITREGKVVAVLISILLVASNGLFFKTFAEAYRQRKYVELERNVIGELHNETNVLNEELQRRQEILERQAGEIEIINTQLQEQNQELQMINAEKNELMGIVAHDLKNPIGAVRTFAELMQEGFIPPKDVGETSEKIVTISNRMLDLVTNLLDVNRLESGAAEFAIVPIDVEPVLQLVIDGYRRQAEAKNILLHYASNIAQTRVLADEQAIVQVIDNLVSNAVKYSPHSKNVFVRLNANTEAVRVEIQDEGPGISAEDMQKLFGKFARLSAQPTGRNWERGRCLLWSCQRLMKNFHCNFFFRRIVFMEIRHCNFFSLLMMCVIPTFHKAAIVLCFVLCPYSLYAVSPIDSLKRVLVLAKHDTTRAMILNEIGWKYWYDNPDSAIIAHKEAITISTQAGFIRGRIKALQGYGFALQLQGKNYESLQILLQALSVSERLDDSLSLSESYNMIGNNYSGQGKHSESIQYFRNALAYSSSKKFIAQLLGNIGISYEALNRADSALWYIERARDIYQELGEKGSFGVLALFLGQVYQRIGQNVVARQYFEEFLEGRDTLIYRKFVGMAYYHLGILDFRAGRYRQALSQGLQAVHFLEQGSFRKQVLDSYLFVSDVYTALQDFEAALVWHKRYHTLADSLNSLESQLRIEEIEGKYTTEKKDREIAVLQAEERVNASVRNGAILGAVFAGLFAVVLWNRYRIKRNSEAVLQQNNEALNEANQQIEYQRILLAERNEELLKNNQRLEEVNLEKNEFLAIAAHDLKNPLASIRLYAEFMTNEKIPEHEHRHFIQSILTLSSRMFSLIDKLLNVNRIETQGILVQQGEVFLRTLLRSCLEGYESSAAQKGICLILAAEKDYRIVSDENLLRQVIDNLISNSIKFSPRDKMIEVRIKNSEPIITESETSSAISHPQFPSAGFIRIEIQDEGPGISEEDMKKLFGKFARLSARPTGGEHSTGLGLSIVKKMVEAMNGRVWCESELGEGAVFIVELPCA